MFWDRAFNWLAMVLITLNYKNVCNAGRLVGVFSFLIRILEGFLRRDNCYKLAK